MADTNYIDYVQPAVSAEWLNEVNDHVWHDTPIAGTTVHNADKISNTPYSTIEATDMQAALNEVVSDLSDSSGSSLVGSVQSGTGAIKRTVQDELRETVKVTQYGAKGDGVTDDTEKVQACFDEHPNAVIVFPETDSFYKLTGSIILSDSSGRNFKGSVVGDNAKIHFVTTGATLDVDSAMAHGFEAFPTLNGAGGDTTGLQDVSFKGLDITGPLHGAPIYLANSIGCSVKHCKTTDSRYGVVTECCINTEISRNSFMNYTNAGIGMIMSGDTARVWYASASPSSSYWNDSPLILGNRFGNDYLTQPLAHILDHGSQSESIRTVIGNLMYSNQLAGSNVGTQYGYLGRNCNVSFLRNWTENVSYPVRILNTNAAEGGGDISGVAGAEPSGSYALSNFPDGYSFNGEFKGNFFARSFISMNLGGITGGPCQIGSNTSSLMLNGGTHLVSIQAGNQMIVDSGDSVISPAGTYAYKALTYNQYVSVFKGDDTGTADALTGNIGEYIDSAVAAAGSLALTTATVKNITSITLTPGDWELGGNICVQFTGATAVFFGGGINTVNNFFTIDRYGASAILPGAISSGLFSGLAIPVQRRKIVANTTFYLNSQANFTAGSAATYGSMWARRVR